MRNALVFAGSSCPELTRQVCSYLRIEPAAIDLGKFANGETKVKILTSTRQKDVFIIQSGGSNINDSVIEMLIIINACKGGSAKKITAVLPYFPYNRQCKKKSQRGSIAAKMIANMLVRAGVNHVLTIDLHSDQMRGFFGCPIDNLHAEPMVANWVTTNVRQWSKSVVVAKNAGGTRRATSLANALGLSWAVCTTFKNRPAGTTWRPANIRREDNWTSEVDFEDDFTVKSESSSPELTFRISPHRDTSESGRNRVEMSSMEAIMAAGETSSIPNLHQVPRLLRHVDPSMPLDTTDGPAESDPPDLEDARVFTDEEEYTDERARDVTQGRLVNGHIVPDDYPSPIQSAMSNSMIGEIPDVDPMEVSHSSSFFNGDRIGGTEDAADSADEEEEDLQNPDIEQTITINGDVFGQTVIIIDDIIDKSGSWIAAAEACVKRGGASKVYCIATHGVFGGSCLAEIEACDCIDFVVVSNSFPVPPEDVRYSSKLLFMDVSHLLSEAIRRTHNGETLHPLFEHRIVR